MCLKHRWQWWRLRWRTRQGEYSVRSDGWARMDATELSVVAGIAASTASGHLNRLLSSGLVICLMQGRHRYYSLAGHHIAGLLET